MRAAPVLHSFAAAWLLLPAPARANPPAPTRAPGPPPPPSPMLPAGDAKRVAEVPVGAGVYRPGRGLEVVSQDGRFSLNLSLWAQLLYTARRDADSPQTAALWTQTLELRRARAVLSGKLFSPHVGYYVHLMFAPKDLGFKDGVPHKAPIFQWYTTWTRLRHANLQAGFFFVPYARQRMQPLPKLQMLDNSSASYEFTLDQDIGAQVSSPDVAGLGKLRYYAGVFMGEGYDWYRPSDFGLTYMSRVDFLPLGMFDDYSESDHERSVRPRLSLGAAYAYSDRDRRTRALGGTAFEDGGSMNSHNLTADLAFKVAGFSALVDVYWREGRRNPGDAKDMSGTPLPITAARNGIGWTAQIGVFVPRTRLELSARSSGVRPARHDTSLARLDEYGAGLSYYFVRHALKLQADYFHAVGPALPAGRTEQLRVQLQASF